MVWIIVNTILAATAISVLATHRQRIAKRDRRTRPGYVPPFWSAGPWTDWLSERPWRVFWYLVVFPVAGLILGVVLLSARDGFGGVLILAALIGAWRSYRPARNALRAARARGETSRHDPA